MSQSRSWCPFEGGQMRNQTVCGELHHLLVMCRRFCTQNPQCKQNLQDYYSVGSFDYAVCALASCSRPCEEQYRIWCSRQHYLQWLRKFCESLIPQQVCRLPHCHKHVYVEIKSNGSLKVHDFCGWDHCQKYHMGFRSYFQLPFTDLHAVNPIASSDESEFTNPEPSMDSVIESLKEYVREKTVPKNVRVDEGFFTKHPWDVLNRPGDEACLLIAKCIWKDKNALKRELITKEGYHWKQQGKPLAHSDGVARRYLTYTRLQRKKRKAQEVDIANDLMMSRRSFYMVEYNLSNADPQFKDYCVVKLHRGKYSPLSASSAHKINCCKTSTGRRDQAKSTGVEERQKAARPLSCCSQSKSPCMAEINQQQAGQTSSLMQLAAGDVAAAPGTYNVCANMMTMMQQLCTAGGDDELHGSDHNNIVTISDHIISDARICSPLAGSYIDHIRMDIDQFLSSTSPPSPAVELDNIIIDIDRFLSSPAASPPVELEQAAARDFEYN